MIDASNKPALINSPNQNNNSYKTVNSFDLKWTPWKWTNTEDFSEYVLKLKMSQSQTDEAFLSVRIVVLDHYQVFIIIIIIIIIVQIFWLYMNFGRLELFILPNMCSLR